MGACGAAGLVAAQRPVRPTAVQEKQEPVFSFQGTTIKTPTILQWWGFVYLDKYKTGLYTVVAVNQLELVYHHTDTQHRIVLFSATLPHNAVFFFKPCGMCSPVIYPANTVEFVSELL